MDFSKIAGYKINTQKPITFLCINNKHVETEINTRPITMASKKMKYLHINLTKCTESDLKLQNCKMQDVIKDQNTLDKKKAKKT